MHDLLNRLIAIKATILKEQADLIDRRDNAIKMDCLSAAGKYNIKRVLEFLANAEGAIMMTIDLLEKE
jgi:hypothetical protein